MKERDVSMIKLGIRALVGEVVCEVRIIAPADVCRGEMNVALVAGIDRIEARIAEHYVGNVKPEPWMGASS